MKPFLMTLCVSACAAHSALALDLDAALIPDATVTARDLVPAALADSLPGDWAISGDMGGLPGQDDFWLQLEILPTMPEGTILSLYLTRKASDLTLTAPLFDTADMAARIGAVSLLLDDHDCRLIADQTLLTCRMDGAMVQLSGSTLTGDGIDPGLFESIYDSAPFALYRDVLAGQATAP